MSEKEKVETKQETETTTDTKKLLDDNITTDDFDKLEQEFKKELDEVFQQKYDEVKGQLLDNVKDYIAKNRKESDEQLIKFQEETRAVQEQLISELKDKFAEVKKEVSARQSYVPDSKNQYRESSNKEKDNEVADFFSDPNVSSAEKYNKFRQLFLNK